MMSRGVYIVGWLVIPVLLGVFLSACEENVSPVLGTDHPFTLYGLFNPTEDIQAIRIYPIEGILELTEATPIDARVTSRDLETGVEFVWQDSIIQYSSGRYGHVVWAPFRAEFEHRYRLDVERSDNNVTRVEAQVPPFSEPEVLWTNPNQFELITPVLWRGTGNLIHIQVRYVSNAGVFDIDYGQNQLSSDEGQFVMVEFRQDTREILRQGFLQGIQDIKLFRVIVTVVVANVEWVPPGGTFDANAFAEPGTFSNVDNGFGFVGAGYKSVAEWVPSDSVLASSGFSY